MKTIKVDAHAISDRRDSINEIMDAIHIVQVGDTQILVLLRPAQDGSPREAWSIGSMIGDGWSVNLRTIMQAAACGYVFRSYGATVVHIHSGDGEAIAVLRLMVPARADSPVRECIVLLE